MRFNIEALRWLFPGVKGALVAHGTSVQTHKISILGTANQISVTAKVLGSVYFISQNIFV